MNDLPLVSIVLAAYNVEKYIDKCIKSVLAQTYKNIEVIIINDGSNDNTENIIKNFKDSRIKYIKKENGGLSSVRNLGYEVFNGQYIIQIDGDDYIEPTLVEKCMIAMVKEKVEMVWYGFDSIKEKGTRRTRTLRKNYTGHIEKNNQVLYKLGMDYLKNMTWQFMVSKNVINRLRQPIVPVNVFYEDLGSTYKIVENVKNIYFMNGIYYHYLLRKSSITNSPSIKKYNDLRKINSKLKQDKLISKDIMTAFNFHIGMLELNILSLNNKNTKVELRRTVKLILNNIPHQISSYEKLKIFLIKIKLYKSFYKIIS